MKCKILLTGCCGFISSHLLDRLLDEGYDVIGVDNTITGTIENIITRIDEFEFVRGDLSEFDVCKRAMNGVDVVCHLAALPSVPRSLADPVASNTNNVDATVKILKAAVDAGVKRILYTSSSSVYGDNPILPKVETMIPNPKSPYAVSKLVGEYYMSVYNRCYGIDTLSFRLFNIIGPRQAIKSQYAAVVPNFMKAAIMGESMIINGLGDASRDFTPVHNVVDAFMRAIEYPGRFDGKIMNIACEKRTTVLELAEMISSIAGVKLNAKFLPDRKGDVKHSLADITIAKEILGYDPTRHSLQDVLKECHAYYTTEAIGDGN